MIGLSGAHRTGKTTLAHAFAQAAGVPFVQTSSSAVFKQMGFDPKVDYDFKIRMLIQKEILNAADKHWRNYTGLFVTDRTPIDMLAYTMADVQRENLDSDDEAIFMDYMNRCFEVLNRHFALIVIVQPGIKLVDEESKAPINKAYIEHIATLIMGIAVDQRCKPTSNYLRRDLLDLDARVRAVARSFENLQFKHLNEVEMGLVEIH